MALKFLPFLVWVVSVSTVMAGELKLQPKIAVSEEYNDNILLAPRNEKSDYITSISPGIAFDYKAPFWDWNLLYSYEYRYYVQGTVDPQPDNVVHLTGQTRVIDNFFFVDLKNDYEKVSLDTSRDYTQESTFVKQTERNIFRIDPYLVFHPASQTRITTGYDYTNTWYKDPESIDTREQSIHAEADQEVSATVTLTGGVRATHNENKVEVYTKKDVFIGQKFEYLDSSTVSASIGYTWFLVQSETRARQPYWEIKVMHKYRTLTASFEAGLRYIPDPTRLLRREDRYLAGITTTIDRTSVSLSGGVTEYRKVETNVLENTNFTIGATASHSVGEDSRMYYAFTVNRLEDNVLNTYTTRYLTDVRFEQTLNRGLVWSIIYRYTEAYSPDVYIDNYKNNRVTLKLTKQF